MFRPMSEQPCEKIKEVLRLHFEARFSERQISKICVLGKGTVRRFLHRAEAAALSRPLLPSLDDATLGLMIFPGAPYLLGPRRPQRQTRVRFGHRLLICRTTIGAVHHTGP